MTAAKDDDHLVRFCKGGECWSAIYFQFGVVSVVVSFTGYFLFFFEHFDAQADDLSELVQKNPDLVAVFVSH